MMSTGIESARVLLVEDDAAHALLMRETLESLGSRIEHTRTKAGALAALELGSFDLIVLDAGLPDGSGFEIQSEIRTRPGSPPIVFVTSDDLAEHAVDALRAGAAHYVVKRPSYLEQMRDVVSELIVRTRKPGRSVPADEDDFALVGASPGIARVRRLIADYGGSQEQVLISGETGTGKELVARGLHAASPRRRGPFIAVNCAAIATHLFESEVFGSVRGAYTGSVRTHEGLVGAARAGTLFLDEVGELPVEVQGKLLRLLEAGTYRPIGASHERAAETRVIAATNKNLERAIQRTVFRADLYYRLVVLQVHLPPLRERREDIPALVTHFASKRTRTGSPPDIAAEAIASLMLHDWPGNVRELEHTVTRTLLRAGGSRITAFDGILRPSTEPEGGGVCSAGTEHLAHLLAQHQGQLGPAATELGTSVRTLQRRLKQLGLRRGDFCSLGE